MMMRNVCLAFALVHADPRSLRGEAMEEVATTKAPEEAAAKLPSLGRIRKLAAVASKDKKWPGGVVRYSLSEAEDVREDIVEALEDIMNKVGRQCVNFKEVKDDSDTTLKFKAGRKYEQEGCAASLGYRKCGNVVILGLNCQERSVLQHEVLHVLGLQHTQTRMDRDDHVNVNWDNILEENADQFYIDYRSHDYGVEYDFESIMHYNTKEGSNKNRDITLTTKVGSQMDKIGKFLKQLSELDVKLIKRMYACDVCTEELTTDCQCGDAKCSDGATCIEGKCKEPLDGSVNCEGGNLDGYCKSGDNNYNYCLDGDDVPCVTLSGTGFCSKGDCISLDCKGIKLGGFCNSCESKHGGSCHTSNGYGVCTFGRCLSRPCLGSNLGENCKEREECGLSTNSCLGHEGASCDALDGFGVCRDGKCVMSDCTGHEINTGICEQCEGKDLTYCKTDNEIGECDLGKCVQKCTDDSGCGPGAKCFESKCVGVP